MSTVYYPAHINSVFLQPVFDKDGSQNNSGQTSSKMHWNNQCFYTLKSVRIVAKWCSISYLKTFLYNHSISRVYYSISFPKTSKISRPLWFCLWSRFGSNWPATASSGSSIFILRMKWCQPINATPAITPIRTANHGRNWLQPAHIATIPVYGKKVLCWCCSSSKLYHTCCKVDETIA